MIGELEENWKEAGEEVGPIRLMFQDEARFGRISKSKRCWCPYPIRPVCPSMVSQEYTYVYGAVSIGSGQWDSLILPHANSQCMQIFLDEISSRYPTERIAMVLDGAGWHRSGSLVVPRNIRLLPLPPYSPELNPTENIWEEIREKWFDNRVFSNLKSLEEQLFQSLRYLEKHIEITQSISSWPWLINAIFV